MSYQPSLKTLKTNHVPHRRRAPSFFDEGFGGDEDVTAITRQVMSPSSSSSSSSSSSRLSMASLMY